MGPIVFDRSTDRKFTKQIRKRNGYSILSESDFVCEEKGGIGYKMINIHLYVSVYQVVRGNAVVTSFRNIITDWWVAASEQVGDIACFSFDISAISLFMFALIAPLLPNVCVGV